MSMTQPLLGDVSAAAMDAVVVGIDPGGHGAVAVLNEAGQLLKVFDMPSTREANGRREAAQARADDKNFPGGLHPAGNPSAREGGMARGMEGEGGMTNFQIFPNFEIYEGEGLN